MKDLCLLYISQSSDWTDIIWIPRGHWEQSLLRPAWVSIIWRGWTTWGFFLHRKERNGPCDWFQIFWKLPKGLISVLPDSWLWVLMRSCYTLDAWWLLRTRKCYRTRELAVVQKDTRGSKTLKASENNNNNNKRVSYSNWETAYWSPTGYISLFPPKKFQRSPESLPGWFFYTQPVCKNWES